MRALVLGPQRRPTLAAVARTLDLAGPVATVTAGWQDREPDDAELDALLDETAFREPTAPIVANTDAAAHTDPAGWPERLARHLTEPVRWRESQRTLAGLGATTFVEVGPGKVLAGLAKRTVPDVTVVNVATPDDVETLAPAMGALASACRRGALGRLSVERADGEHILAVGDRANALRQALEDAGFLVTPRGLRLRG